MSRDLHVRHLGSLIGGWTGDEIGDQISKHSDLRCAAEPRAGYSDRPDATATEADHDRWRSATDQLLTTIRELQDQARQAGLHKRPPFRRRTMWHIRYARRNQLLRNDYDRRIAELLTRFDDAVTTYQAQAGDLPAYLVEWAKQEQQRLKDEAARAHSQRAAAMEAATEPLWAYKLNIHSGTRSFWIYLTSLDRHLGAQDGLTPTEVHAALVAERAEHPYTSVMWGSQTSQALKDKYQTEVSGWKALSGTLIDPHPLDPNRPRTRSTYYGGPSSNYGSDGGASGHSGCGGGFSGCGGGFSGCGGGF